MHPATINLNQTIVLTLMEMLEHWERWAEVVPRGATKALNQQLIRLSKGLIKAYRTFLVDLQHNNQLESASSQPAIAALSPSAHLKEISNGN